MQVFNKLIKLSCFILLFAVSSAYSANLNMSVVDVVSLQSNLMEEVNTKLQTEFKDKQVKLQTKIDDFKKENDKFQKDLKTMSKDKAEKMTTAMQTKQFNLQQEIQKFDSEVAKRREAELKTKLQVVEKVVKQISGEKKYDLILAKSAALFVKDSFDITKTVLDRYKAESKK